MVVWMQAVDADGNDEGHPVHFGRVCAAMAAGWGHGTKSATDKRIARELAETNKHYRTEASKAIAKLETNGLLVRTRVAMGFDWKSATHSYGIIFVLPGDAIETMSDPIAQAAEIKSAKARRNLTHPICRFFDENLTAIQIKEMLSN